jgi:hypothetical protein
MASRTVVELTDDFDGKRADETVTFALDGVSYEIDLSAKNAAELRQALAAYIEVGRRVGRGSRSGRNGRATTSAPRSRSGADYDPAAVRAWAASNKVNVSARGRISSSVLEQFRAAGH